MELLGLDRDKNPWLQLAEGYAGGLAELKKAPGCGQTVADQLHQQELKALTEEQKRQYDKEEDSRNNDEGQAEFDPGSATASPMHDLVNDRVLAAERHIERSLKNQMTPSELAELDKALKVMDDQYLDWKNHFNKNGSADSGPLIEPGPAILSYFERIAHAVETRSVADMRRRY
jgi:hypothetical protein